MKPDNLVILRRMLETQLDDLRQRADSTVVDLMRNEPDSEPDPLDRASLEENRGYYLRIRDRESRLINKIKNCLLAIDQGDYGICQNCGEAITFARLMARPVTSFCIDCKSRLEALEKAVGQ